MIPYPGVMVLLQMPGGPAWGFGNRDASFAVPAWIERGRRAHTNMVENLAPFACLVLVAHVAGKANATTAFASRALSRRARRLHDGVHGGHPLPAHADLLGRRAGGVHDPAADPGLSRQKKIPSSSSRKKDKPDSVAASAGLMLLARLLADLGTEAREQLVAFGRLAAGDRLVDVREHLAERLGAARVGGGRLHHLAQARGPADRQVRAGRAT